MNVELDWIETLDPKTSGAIFGSGDLLSDVPLAPPDPELAEALFFGVAWADTTLTYSFPQHWSDYDWTTYSFALEAYPDFFIPMRADGRAIMAEVFAAWDAVSGLDLTLAAPGEEGTLQVAGTTVTPSAWGYEPGEFIRSGDIWFNLEKPQFTRLNDSSGGHVGSGAFSIAMHEAGHALGLKHPHEMLTSNPKALAVAYDSLEFTVMSYRSYAGDPSPGGYSNATWGFPQSLMMLDIAAIQQLYGADYGHNAGDTVYAFDPATGEMTVDGVSAGMPGENVILRTIWDGNGNDTLDFSRYTTDLRLDLGAGAGSDLDVGGNAQRTQMTRQGEPIFAANQLYMSLLFEENPLSLIENALGGSGDDRLTGNGAANWLNGGLGSDVLMLGGGADTVAGTLADLDGDRVIDFTSQDTLVILGMTLASQAVAMDRQAGHILIDADLDGSIDALVSSDTDLGAVLQVAHNGVVTSVAHAAAGAVVMSDADERLIASGNFNRVLDAGGGDDNIRTDGGNDLLLGGEGDDLLFGRTGDDTLDGGTGTDTLRGGYGSDIFLFRAGDHATGLTLEEIVDFSPGNDRIQMQGYAATSLAGLSAVDNPNGAILHLSATHSVQLSGVTVAALSNADFIFEQVERDFGLVSAGGPSALTDGDDQYRTSTALSLDIAAGAGDDLLVLGSGNDTLWGGNGSDLLYGDSGDDRIIGGRGGDRAAGQAGADTFVFARDDAPLTGFDLDYIADFALADDRVEIGGYGAVTVGAFQFVQSGSNIFMLLGNTHAIAFENVAFNVADLTSSGVFDFA
jgi:serralysin